MSGTTERRSSTNLLLVIAALKCMFRTSTKLKCEVYSAGNGYQRQYHFIKVLPALPLMTVDIAFPFVS